VTDPKEKKTKTAVPKREPQKRTHTGMFDNLRRLPHPVEEILGLAQLPSESPSSQIEEQFASTPNQELETEGTPSTPPTPSRGSTQLSLPGEDTRSNSHIQTEVAPRRDFSRVANSISREAVPAGLFTGKSKQLYDFLYAQTRGAIVPKRSTRISREKLMKGSDIGSDITLRANLSKLRSVGLIEIREIGGTHGGNQYTVFLPEELGFATSSTPSTPSTPPRLPDPPQKLEGVEGVETRGGRGGLSPEESITSGILNTFFNTHDDDDGVNEFADAIRQAGREILGEALPQSDLERERWRECGALLAEEMKQAAARAGSVSSIPAFFAAHLRRRFKTSQSHKTVARPDLQSNKSPVASLTKEQRLLKMIKELRALHVGDPGYEKKDLIDDLKYKCDRDGLGWDEALINQVLERRDDDSVDVKPDDRK
jgi:hypothetical protein